MNAYAILHDQLIMSRFKVFTEKIDALKSHKKYKWLKAYADNAICGSLGNNGIVALAAKEFIRRIEEMPLDYIRGWLDGRNDLEWKERRDEYEDRGIA